MSGWIKYHRSIENWEWYDDAYTLKLFLYIISNANIENKRWKGIEIKRGQLVTSLDKLSERTNMTKKRVYKRLNDLVSSGEVTKEGTVFTLITVCKYETYQENGAYKGTGKKHKGNTKGTERETTKEVKEIKNNNMADFEVFWNEYNHKHKKADSKKLWSKLKKTEKDLIMIHVPKYIIQTPDKIYRLYPDKYIRQRRWEDDNGKELTPKEKMLAKHNYKPMGA